MPAMERLWRRHWLGLLAAGSLAAVVIAVNPVALAGVLRGVQPAAFLLMVPPVIISYAARGLGWRVALRRVGMRAARGRSVAIMIAGQSLIFLPTGDLGRVALVMETGSDGCSAGEIAATITFQELVFMTVMGVAAVPAVVEQRGLASLLLVLLLVLTAIVIMLVREPAYRRGVEVAEHIPLVRRLDRELVDLRPAFLRLLNPRTAAAVTGWTIVGAAAAFVAFELALRAVGITSVGYLDALSVYALGHLLGAVSMLPGGIGVYEGVLTGFMALHGVPPSQGAAAALLYRGCNDLLMALFGLAVAWALRRQRRERASALRDPGEPAQHPTVRDAPTTAP
jgi:uncharacterized membrane protein YbhN (UPF0104 family)